MRRFVISEKSMSPALEPGDRYVARRLRHPRRGRIVFFPHPHRADFWLAKRIIGLPGELVEVIDGEVVIDGETLAEPWTLGSTSPSGSWKVPEGHIFVLSDARHRTRADSRAFGPVPVEQAHLAMLCYRRSR